MLAELTNSDEHDSLIDKWPISSYNDTESEKKNISESEIDDENEF